MTYDDLMRLADGGGIQVLDAELPTVESCSVLLPDWSCAVGIDPARITSSADAVSKLAHELGHCFRGAFYNRHSPYDLVCQHEYKADRWAVETLMPREDVDAAMRDGAVEVWQLAERFGVSERLVRRALWIYYDKEV